MKLITMLTLALLLAGCCSDPNAITRIQETYAKAQALAYGIDGELLPDVAAALNDPKVKEGVAAVDLVLALTAMAKTQWCASQATAAQVQAAAATAVERLGDKGNPTP